MVATGIYVLKQKIGWLGDLDDSSHKTEAQLEKEAEEKSTW